jgi:hypothetical protein
MTVPAPYAILLRDAGQPSADAVRRAFRTFSHLTDADAVRLAANAQGILMRHLRSDEARALQVALAAEGVAAALVHEQELQLLPPAQTLHRIELTPDALVIHDVVGRTRAVVWDEIIMLAAGAVGHVDVATPPADRANLKFGSFVGDLYGGPARSRIETGQHLILELILRRGAARFEILAHLFPFNYVLPQPAGSLTEKFVWLAGELILRIPGAALNRGAEDVRDGVKLVRGYPNRQAFQDEMLWRLWNAAHHRTP